MSGWARRWWCSARSSRRCKRKTPPHDRQGRDLRGETALHLHHQSIAMTWYHLFQVVLWLQRDDALGSASHLRLATGEPRLLAHISDLGVQPEFRGLVVE